MNERPFLCLKCWRANDFLNLNYICPRCSTAQWTGQRPRRVRSRFSRWTLLFNRPSAVTCPKHRDTTAQLLCKCGAPVQRENQVNMIGRRPVGLGLAGAAGAGKTVMMLSALREMRGKMDSPGSRALLGIGDTESRFALLEDEFFHTGRKPSRTDEMSVHGFGWRVSPDPGTRQPESLLLLCDVAGEVWSGGADNSREELGRYFGLLRKLVLVIDGASVAADLGLEGKDAWDPNPRRGDQGARDAQVLSYLISKFDSARRDIDIALAISKGDLLWDSKVDEWAGLKAAAAGNPGEESALEEVLRRSGRRNLLVWSRAKFRDTKLFIFSGLGFRPEASQVSADLALVPPPAPLGAARPVQWLLNGAPRTRKEP
jgi:hypothetical protein